MTHAVHIQHRVEDLLQKTTFTIATMTFPRAAARVEKVVIRNIHTKIACKDFL